MTFIELVTVQKAVPRSHLKRHVSAIILVWAGGRDKKTKHHTKGVCITKNAKVGFEAGLRQRHLAHLVMHEEDVKEVMDGFV